jgi:hypothetical protein
MRVVSIFSELSVRGEGPVTKRAMVCFRATGSQREGDHILWSVSLCHCDVCDYWKTSRVTLPSRNFSDGVNVLSIFSPIC